MTMRISPVTFSMSSKSLPIVLNWIGSSSSALVDTGLAAGAEMAYAVGKVDNDVIIVTGAEETTGDGDASVDEGGCVRGVGISFRKWRSGVSCLGQYDF